MLKSRRYPRERPHSWHRLFLRTLNFGLRFALAIMDFLAMSDSYKCWVEMFSKSLVQNIYLRIFTLLSQQKAYRAFSEATVLQYHWEHWSQK